MRCNIGAAMRTRPFFAAGFRAWAAFVFAFSLAGPPAQAQEEPAIKIGFVTFLSGGAAGPFGVPARNAQRLVVEAINRGEVPAPYDSVGIAGALIDPVVIDEAGGTDTQVREYRKLVQKHEVNLVIGYVSSGNCKAIAPVAEELETLTVFTDCGTPQIFERIVPNPKYLFRTGAHATMDGVAAARYLLDLDPDVGTIAGINQNYAWGQDSWQDFVATMEVLEPSITVTAEHFPKIFAGQYSSEISALLTTPPGAIHSSFWGGDMEALVYLGAARGLFGRSRVILTTGETAMHRLGAQMPDGTILGGRGAHGNFAPDNALNKWFRGRFYERYQAWPTYPSYRMANAILAVKAAYEKAPRVGGGTPRVEDVIAAFEGLEFKTPSGAIEMAISGGHQAIQGTAYGQYRYDPEGKRGSLVNVRYYKARCVNPPEGIKSLDWIRAGFPGADCAPARPLRVAPLPPGPTPGPVTKVAVIVIDALVYSSWLFIVSIGLTLVYGVMRILNVAHGSLYAIGAYAAASLVGVYFAQDNAAPFAIYALMPLVALGWAVVVGLIIERGLLRLMYGRDEIIMVLVTYAVFLILEDVMKVLWGVDPYFAFQPYGLLGDVDVLGVGYAVYELALIAVAAGGGGITWWALNRTNVGKFLVAVIHDREMSVALGINVSLIFTVTFVLGAALGALGGALTAPTTSVVPGMGVEVIVLAFAVIVIGGLGSIGGAIVGALIVGFARATAVHLLPEVELFVIYAVMSLVLVFRPHGLFASPEARKI